MARPQGIQNAYKGTSVDLSIICDNLSEIPIVLHAKTTDLFISHLIVSQCEREIPLEKLELMDQALRGIYLLMASVTLHQVPSTIALVNVLLPVTGLMFSTVRTSFSTQTSMTPPQAMIV